MRKELLYLMEADEWKELISSLLRSDAVADQLAKEPYDVTPEDLVDVLDHHWATKRNKGAESFWSACALENEIDEMVANGMTRKDAKKRIQERDRPQSFEAFEKWLRRNLNP